MSKIWNENELIPWICNDDEEDFFASIGDYLFRVEQMNRRHWWWRVTFHGHAIQTPHNEFATCRINAIRLAEGVYYGHLAAMKENEQTVLNQLIKNRK